MYNLSPDAFFTQAFMAFPRYQEDNSWFEWETHSLPQGPEKFDINTPVHYIFAANKAYEKVADNKQQLTLLGDTKLRSDEALVGNFGLSSAKGVQEQECVALIQKLTNQRRVAAGMEAIDYSGARLAKLPQDDKGRKIIPVEGAGAILSTKKWSPMLNDSFIISGAHHEHEFSLALVGEEATSWAGLSAVKDDKERWRSFFLKNPTMLWGATNVPRVLTRELIGLLTFGFEPLFDKDQLSFKVASPKAADGANHTDYLTALSKVDFNRQGKAKCVAAIAKFLFGKTEALDAGKEGQAIGALAA
jgi:hypothetical protein